MSKKIVFLALFITLAFNVFALTIHEARVKDILDDDLSIKESMTLTLTNNTKDTFNIILPKDSYNIYVNNKSTLSKDNSITIPLSCTLCNINISYKLDNVIRKDKSQYLFSRVLNFPTDPSLMSYEIYIPPGSVVGTNNTDPSIVPTESNIRTDGKSIIIVWNELNPSMPKQYTVRYTGEESLEKNSEFTTELSEWQVWVLILVFLMIGVGIGYALREYYHRSLNRSLPYVPSQLLSPDERSIIKVLMHNDKVMNQKEIGKSLNWSKSKVSAIITNLEYKEIINREKIGRNYKVELIKAVDKL